MPSWSIVSKASPTKAAISMRLRFGLGNAARAQIEELIVVDVAGCRAMAADDIVGKDLELGLGVEFRRLGEQQRVARLLAVGLLGVAAATMTLPWKMPRACSSITHLNISRLVHFGTR